MGDAHGAAGGVAKGAGSGLLQSAGDEGRLRLAGQLPVHDLVNHEGTVGQVRLNRLHLIRILQFRLLVTNPGQPNLKGIERVRLFSNFGPQQPVLIRRKALDLTFAFANQPQGHGLYPARAFAATNAAPEQGADLIPHDAVDYPPGLLRVHPMHVNTAGISEGLANGRRGDFVVGHTKELVRIHRFGQGVLKVPGDRLPFTVRIRGKIDLVDLLGLVLQFFQDLLPTLDGDVLRLKICLDIYAQLLFRQVADVSH